VLGRKARARGEQTRRQHAGVVEDEEIAGAQMGREIAEVIVGGGSAASIDAEHAAGAANRRGVLCDEFFGEVEVEIGDEHELQFTFARSTARSSDRCSVASDSSAVGICAGQVMTTREKGLGMRKRSHDLSCHARNGNA
jgi:hypothetical protein